MLIAFGTAIIYYRFRIHEFTGEWDWANTYVGNTANAIVIFGMILIGAGAAYPFGAFDDMNSTSVMIQKP